MRPPPQHVFDNANPKAIVMLAQMGFTREGASIGNPGRSTPAAHARAAGAPRVDIVEMAKRRLAPDSQGRPPEAREPNLRIDIVANMKKRHEGRRLAR